MAPISSFTRGGGSIGSSVRSPAAGDTVVRGSVPAGASAVLKRNGVSQGAATVTAQGAASYTLSSPAVSGDVFSFAWTLAADSPTGKVPSQAASGTTPGTISTDLSDPNSIGPKV